MSTTSTTHDTFASSPQPDPSALMRDGVLAAGLYALATHTIAYRLPAPSLVDLEVDPTRPAAVNVHIQGGQGAHQRWLDSVDEVLDVQEEFRQDTSLLRWKVRLPETCAVVTLVGIRLSPARLQAVTD